MLDPPVKILRFLLLLGILAAASTAKRSSIEEFSLDDYDDFSLNEIKPEKFSCEGRPYGYYADQGQDCKVFHICSPIESHSGRHVKAFIYSFNCPETTIFSQDSRTCISEKYALPCRRAHTLYSLNKSIGQITPKGAKKHVPSFTANTNFHTSNVIIGDSRVTPKLTIPSVASQRFSSGNSTYKPTVRRGSQTGSNLANTENKLNSAKKENSMDKSFDLKVKVGSTAAEKSEAKAIDGFKGTNTDETSQTDDQKEENVNKVHSISISNDKTRVPNTIINKDNNVHQSLLSSQKSSKDAQHVNKQTVHHPAVGKPNPSFNFRASLGNSKEEENHSPIISEKQQLHVEDSPSQGSTLSPDKQSLVQNSSSIHVNKPLVKISPSNPIQLPKSDTTTTSSNNVKLNQNKKLQNLNSKNTFDKVTNLDENNFTDFYDYEINDPELEEIYEEIYEFKPKPSDSDEASGYVDGKEIDSKNNFSSPQQNKNPNKHKSPALRGALSEKILPPPPISNSLLNHNVILTNIRARHNESTINSDIDGTSTVPTQTENENEGKIGSANNVQVTTESTKQVASNTQSGRGRSQGRGTGRTSVEGTLNNIARVEEKPLPPLSITRGSLPVRTTAAIQKITTTTRSPVPRNLTTTTLRPIPSERGSKRFVPSSLLRQNSNLKESQLNQIDEQIKIKPKKQSINIQSSIPVTQRVYTNQNLHSVPITQKTKDRVTTSRPFGVTQTSRPINILHDVNLVTATEEETTTILYVPTQTTTEKDNFEKTSNIDVTHTTKELVNSSELSKPPTVDVGNKESALPKEQNGKVRIVTRTRLSPKSNTELTNIEQKSGASGLSNRAPTNMQSLDNFEQKINKVAIESNTFRKANEYQQTEQETTVGPLDENLFDDLIQNKKINIETASFRETNQRVNINKDEVRVSSQNDALYHDNLDTGRGPSHGELILNKERPIGSQTIDTSRQNEGQEKTITNNSVRKVNKVVKESVNSQVLSRRRTTSRNRGSATFELNQNAKSKLDTNRQAKSIAANAPVELPKLNDVAGNSVKQIPSKTRIVPSSKTVIISNINPIYSSTTEISNNKQGTEEPIRKRIVASPQPSNPNSRRRGNKDSKNLNLKTGGNLQVSTNKTATENNFAARTNLLPKISGKLNLGQLSEIEKQIQRFASVNGAQLISYVVKKNDKHPKNKNKIEATQGSKNTTEAKFNEKAISIKEVHKLVASKPSIPVSSAVTPLGKSNRINIQFPSKSSEVYVNSIKKSTITNNYDDELLENVNTTVGPQISTISGNDGPKYLPINKQTSNPNEEPQSRSVIKNPEATSVKSQSPQTTNKLPKTIGSSISPTLNVDIGKIRPATNSNKRAGGTVDVKEHSKVLTRQRPTPHQSKSSISNLEIPTVTTVADETIQETTTAIPKVVSRQRSRGRSQSARAATETISTSKQSSDLNNNAAESIAVVQNENVLKDSPALPEKTSAEEKNVAKNLRASNMEKIRNRVSVIQRNKEILPDNSDEKDSLKSVKSEKLAENHGAGVRSPVNLLNSLKNIKSQRERFKGGSSSIALASKSLTNETLISVSIELENEVSIEREANEDDLRTTTLPTTPKPSLNSRRFQVRPQGRSRNPSDQETLKENAKQTDGKESIKVVTSSTEKEFPVESTVRPVNSQNSRSGRTRGRISNTPKSIVPATETNSSSIRVLEVLDEHFVNENTSSNVVNAFNSQPKKVTRTRNVNTPTEQNSSTQENKLKVVAPRITRKRLTTQSQTEATPKEITENPVNSELVEAPVNSLSEVKNGSNSIDSELKSGNSIRRVSRKRVTAKNIISEIRKDNASATAESSSPATVAKENTLNRNRITSQSSTATRAPSKNSDVTRKRLLSPDVPDPQETISNNENLGSALKLETTSANSARKVSRKRITPSKTESTLPTNHQPSQEVVNNTEANQKEENTALGANSLVAEKAPVNSVRRVSRKRVTTQVKPNASESANPDKSINESEINDVIHSVRKVSPNILDSFTSTTEKPKSSPRKDQSSRRAFKINDVDEGSQFASELLTDVNEKQEISTGAQQYSIAVTGSEANTKNKILKKVIPARQFQQKLPEGAVENAEVFSGLKLRVVGTSVKSTISSTSKADDKKSNLDLTAAASRTNTRTLTDLELDALRSLTQVNEPLRQPGRSRNINRRLISKRKV